MIDSVDIFKASKKYGSDKHIHGYDQYYDDVFQETPTSILEIGIKKGASLLMWKELFPEARVTGMDINQSELSYEQGISLQNNGIRTFFGDSTDPVITGRMKNTHDIIIDDGSHFYIDIMATFDNFCNKFNKYYIIEDAMWDVEGIVDYIKSKGFANVKVYDSLSEVNVPVGESFLKYNKRVSKDKQIPVTLKWIKVTR